MSSKNNKNSSKIFKAGSYSLLSTLILAGIVIAINILAGYIPTKYTQFDTSDKKLYTISDDSKSILKNLTDDISIYWITKEAAKDTSIELLLNEYSSYSSKIKVKKIDPELNPSFSKKYTDNLTNNSIVVELGDRFKYIPNSDIFIEDYSNYYTDQTIDQSFAGESAITSAIDYCINPDLPKLYSLTGHEEYTLPQYSLDAIQKQNIEYSEFSLISENSVPDDADVVFVCVPKKDITANEKDILKDYLANGGKIVMITETPDYQVEFTNLNELMSFYGINLVNGFVIDPDTSYYTYDMPYFILPHIESNSITSNHVNKHLFVLMPFAQGATISTDLRETLHVSQLLTSSVSSFSRADLNENSSLEKNSADIDGPFVLGAVASESNEESGKTSNLIWFGSSGLIDQQIDSMVAGSNMDLFINTINSTIDKTGTRINIPTKSLSTDTLTLTNSTSNLFKIIFLVVIPVGYLLIGIYIFNVRRKR